MNNTTDLPQQNNKGQLTGVLLEKANATFEVEGEKFYEGKIAVERLSEAVDILPFTISEKLVKAYSLALEKGCKVSFGGEFRSYNRVIDGKSRLILSFFVKEVLPESEDDNDNVNAISLTGYVCKQPNYRTTPFNRQICDVLIAVNRSNFNKSDYIPCILWGRNAKLMQNQKVGTKVVIDGRIQSRIYRKETSPGLFEEKTAYEVSCQNLTLCDSVSNYQADDNSSQDASA